MHWNWSSRQRVLWFLLTFFSQFLGPHLIFLSFFLSLSTLTFHAALDWNIAKQFTLLEKPFVLLR